MKKTPTKSSITLTGPAARALEVLKAEYLRQLGELALELRTGFELGAYGAFTGESDDPRPSPAKRLDGAIRERVPASEQLEILVLAASPNRWQALDDEWSDRHTAVVEAIAIDLCMVAEANGWSKTDVEATWQWPGNPSPVRPVTVRLPEKAA